MELTDNLNIKQFKPLITPWQLKEQLPISDQVSELVTISRKAIQNILLNKDSRTMIIVGPCSLHDCKATLEYAQKLKQLQQQVADKILIIMRAYFEKPRTTLGWKGMIYDPHLDNSYDIEGGLRQARELSLSIANIGLPIAVEFLDPIVPQYLADLVSWAAIGARTTESQIHRQMASGLSMPTGFKNATDGNLTTAIDAVKAASSPHSFMGIDRNGQVVIAETGGNKYGHIVMRGGADTPNFGSEYVAFAEILLSKANIPTGIVIDCSHANSYKDYKKQGLAFMDVADQIHKGNSRIVGLMLESFLKEGSQPFDRPQNLEYGVSLTDSCIGWEETEQLITHLAKI
ncbi:MAG: 3-deoxy-7-phosphoheptulonate synthase [Sedimentisphaerales bacterium]|nr:3-deoxy-7-phosphoheptulonate synthase [Sedimentisphaerales bacterium]